MGQSRLTVESDFLSVHFLAAILFSKFNQPPSARGRRDVRPTFPIYFRAFIQFLFNPTFHFCPSTLSPGKKSPIQTEKLCDLLHLYTVRNGNARPPHFLWTQPSPNFEIVPNQDKNRCYISLLKHLYIER